MIKQRNIEYFGHIVREEKIRLMQIVTLKKAEGRMSRTDDKYRDLLT